MQPFLEYLFNRLKNDKPVTQLVGAQTYAIKADGTLGEPVRELAPQWQKPTLQVGTLSSLVDLVKAKLDDYPERVALQVVDYRTVALLDLVADEFGRRHKYAFAQFVCETPFVFNSYLDPEPFVIAFRSSFVFTDDAVKVQKVCSTITSGGSVSTADDGISQQVTVTAGTVTRATVELPAEGIPLVPWRTFREVPPVESKFLLRMKGVKDQLPKVALFEIDARWQLDTVLSIAKWLKEQLPEMPVIA